MTYKVGPTLTIYCTIPQLMDTHCPASVPPLVAQWAHTSSFYDTVGLYPLIYLHSEHQRHHLMNTYCPVSVCLLLAQWAHTSSFQDTLGLYPLIYLHNGHHPSHLLDTNCPVSVPPLPTQWAHTFSLYNLLTPLNLETGIKGQIQFLQIINSL